MSKHLYEIRLRGAVRDDVLSGLAAQPPPADTVDRVTTVTTVDTVLITSRVDQDGLHLVLSRITDFGLEFCGLKRLPYAFSMAQVLCGA